MKLVPDPWRMGSEAGTSSSSGRWHSEGSDWAFQRVQGGWRISSNYPHPGTIPPQKRLALMKKFGLGKALFKTRRDAVQTLTLLLAGTDIGQVTS